MTMTGDLLGTLRYMSPEQALAKRVVVDHRTDVYSLGATLYELLTLQPVFAGDDRQEILHQIAQSEPPAPRKLNSAVPVDLETIVLKSLAKNPADRYTTAGELAADLQRLLDHQPIDAKPPTLIQRATKWSRRHTAVVRSAIAAMIVVTIVSTLAGMVAWNQYRESDRQRGIAEGNERETDAALAEAERQRRRAETNEAEAKAQAKQAKENLTKLHHHLRSYRRTQQQLR